MRSWLREDLSSISLAFCISPAKWQSKRLQPLFGTNVTTPGGTLAKKALKSRSMTDIVDTYWLAPLTGRWQRYKVCDEPKHDNTAGLSVVLPGQLIWLKGRMLLLPSSCNQPTARHTALQIPKQIA